MIHRDNLFTSREYANISHTERIVLHFPEHEAQIKYEYEISSYSCQQTFLC